MIPKNAANNATKKSNFFIIVLDFAYYTPLFRKWLQKAAYLSKKTAFFVAIYHNYFYNFG
jgi:hypothetical protein